MPFKTSPILHFVSILTFYGPLHATRQMNLRIAGRNLFNKKYNVNVPLGIIADPSQKLTPQELGHSYMALVAF